MCLLVNQVAASPALSDAWLKDFYSYNSDGVGVMYVEGDELIIEKILPKTDTEFVQFYRTHIQGKDCSFHLRMKTHGDIDMENCHPYEVLNKSEHGIDLWLMHNGILHTGNDANKSKSDTWHYIRDFLRPMLEKNPDFAFSEAFAILIGEHISSGNKFVLMDNLGRRATVNANQGVYWGGMWLSNTYAWTAPSKEVSKEYIDDQELAELQVSIEPVKQRYSYKYSGYKGYNTGYYNDWDYAEYESYNPVGKTYHNSYGKNSYDDYAEVELDVDDICCEMGIAGLTRAEKFSRRQIMQFIDKFGYESFVDIAYMVIDKDIDEDNYIKLLSDFAYAREMFPFLAREESKIVNMSYVE